jgi:hypothetical protein
VRQEAIADIIQMRFHPTETEMEEVKTALTAITSESRLRALMLAGVEADTLAAFRAALGEG